MKATPRRCDVCVRNCGARSRIQVAGRRHRAVPCSSAGVSLSERLQNEKGYGSNSTAGWIARDERGTRSGRRPQEGHDPRRRHRHHAGYLRGGLDWRCRPDGTWRCRRVRFGVDCDSDARRRVAQTQTPPLPLGIWWLLQRLGLSPQTAAVPQKAASAWRRPYLPALLGWCGRERGSLAALVRRVLCAGGADMCSPNPAPRKAAGSCDAARTRHRPR